MSSLGKKIRMNRLVDQKSGRFLGITVDHAMARGVMTGLDTIGDTLEKLVEAHPNAITMHKGLADKCFKKHAGKVPLIVKCSTFSPFQPEEDTLVCSVDEAIYLGGDAVSVGCIVGGDKQPEQITALASMSKDAMVKGMPLVAHIYPRGFKEKKDWYKVENIMYAARLGAELGVDIIKTNYTGDMESFAKVVECCPAMVVAAGGEPGQDIKHYFEMTKSVIDAGGAGVTYGRFIFQYKNPTILIEALKQIIFHNSTVKESMDYLEHLLNPPK